MSRTSYLRSLLIPVTVAAFLLAACSGETNLPPSPTAVATITSIATRAPETTPTIPPATATAGPQGPPAFPTVIENGGVTGTFLEPVRTIVANIASLGEPVVPSFEPWDRQTVVLYDLETGSSTSFGPGFFAGFSGDGASFGYTNDGLLWVVDVGTGEQTSYTISGGGIATLIGDHYAIVPAAEGSLVDLDTGERRSVQDIDDPELRYAVEQRLRPAGGALLGDGLVLRRADWEQAPCSGGSEAAQELCRAEAFEQWWVEELATGRRVLEFRAIAAAPAGPGELVIATSPQCVTEAGATKWCSEVLAALRPTLDRAAPVQTFASGTTNIFIVDIETGAAEFVATATYNPPAFVWPMNWPLIADQDRLVWTESYCGMPQGKTRILARATGDITELDGSHWLRWHGGFIGLGAFSSYAIIDPATLDYVAAVPPELSGVAWSKDFRYAAVGAVLGHGGLCG